MTIHEQFGFNQIYSFCEILFFFIFSYISSYVKILCPVVTAILDFQWTQKNYCVRDHYMIIHIQFGFNQIHSFSENFNSSFYHMVLKFCLDMQTISGFWPIKKTNNFLEGTIRYKVYCTKEQFHHTCGFGREDFLNTSQSWNHVTFILSLVIIGPMVCEK